jgi:SAM-dependent methyltransferase
MNRGDISGLIRKLRLSHLVDYLRYNSKKISNSAKNKAFKVAYPEVKLPPDYLIYESFQMDYERYYAGGRKTAEWLVDHWKNHKNLENAMVLDWGCGPGRTIRHLPDILGAGCSVFGTDVNEKSIAWCQENIDNIDFSVNKLDPPFTYSGDKFDVAYAISILTHLSEAKHHSWLAEIKRVLKKDGIFFVTTHGEVFKTVLAEAEVKAYENNEIVIRGHVREGHRVYGAFHPPVKIREIFEQYFTVLMHEPGTIRDGKPGQDKWILQKK